MLPAGVLSRWRRGIVLAVVYWASLSAAAQENAKTPEVAWPRFNGRDLDGWKVVDQHFFERRGKVYWNDDAVILDAGRPGTAIAWKGETPRQNYQVTFEAKRIAGDDFFCGLTFPVDKNYCTLILGGWGGGTTGLSNIDDFAAVENETTGYHEFKTNHWYRIRLRVTPARIQAWLDEQLIVDVEAGNKRFSIWWEQEPARPLGIASWNTAAAVRRLRVESVAPRKPEPEERVGPGAPRPRKF